LETETQEKNVA